MNGLSYREIIEDMKDIPSNELLSMSDRLDFADAFHTMAMTGFISAYALLENLTYEDAELLLSRFDESSEQVFNTSESIHFLYLIQQKGTNLYKIGITSNLNNRMQCLKIGNPNELQFVAHRKIKDSYKAERYLHLYFRKKLVRGEWFELTESDIQTLIKVFGFEMELNKEDSNGR